MFTVLTDREAAELASKLWSAMTKADRALGEAAEAMNTELNDLFNELAYTPPEVVGFGACETDAYPYIAYEKEIDFG